ncbi:hypothetical protein B0H11DRAFT_1961027, partial [Mycena galericulata]
MVSFETFLLPVVLGGGVLVTIVLGVGCRWWGMWLGGTPIPSRSTEEEERPQIWDLVIDHPVGAKIDDTRWANLQPFSVMRLETTERCTVPERDRLTKVRRTQRRRRKIGDEVEDACYHDLSIAVTIAMPSARNPSPSSYTTDSNDGEHLTFCIGLQQELVEGLSS